MISERELLISLIASDVLKHANAIVILEGDGINRIRKGCELFHSQWAEELIFSGGIDNPGLGSFPFNKISGEFEKYNIPEDKVIVESRSLHTRQQAEEIIKLSVVNHWKRIILIASPYHQCRAFLTFLKVLQENLLEEKIELINCSADGLSWFLQNEWGRRIDLIKEEFDKIDEYSHLGHIAKISDALKYFEWKEQFL
jgi:hypothetical protein